MDTDAHIWRDKQYLKEKARPFDKWRMEHGKPRQVQVDAEIDDMPYVPTFTFSDAQRKLAQQYMQTESGVESYDTVPMEAHSDKLPIITPQPLLWRWDLTYGYRNIETMLYQARWDYFKRYQCWPRTMTVSWWNWLNARYRHLNEYPIQAGLVKRDEVYCE